MRKWLRHREQPSLQEMLDDPIVQALMERDGVSREEVEQLVSSVQIGGASSDSARVGTSPVHPSLEGAGAQPVILAEERRRRCTVTSLAC